MATLDTIIQDMRNEVQKIRITDEGCVMADRLYVFLDNLEAKTKEMQEDMENLEGENCGQESTISELRAKIFYLNEKLENKEQKKAIFS